MPCSYRSLYDADAGEGFLIYILIFKYFVITPVIGGDRGCDTLLWLVVIQVFVIVFYQQNLSSETLQIVFFFFFVACHITLELDIISWAE